MSGTQQERRPQRWETNRVEAFSDGVFAIAITLLVLDIKVGPVGLRRSGARPRARSRHATALSRTHRSIRQPTVPRHDDVRRLGQHRPRRLDPHHPPRARRGINFIDTADIYSAGESEELVGKALKSRRDDVVLATKFWGPMGEDPNQRGVSRRWIIAEVENSLRRLDTDWIDLYQMHRPDPNTDIDETLGALTDLVHQGKIRYIGSSSFSAGQIVEAQWAARDRHLEHFRTEQPPYSMLVRSIELDVLPTAQRHGMGILTYSPLAGGWLSGRYRKNANASPASSARARGALSARFDMSLPENHRKLEAVEQLAKVADDAGLSLIELAIGFVVSHPAVTSAIIGPRTMEQLESQLPAADITLEDAVLDRIDEIIQPGVNLNPADTSYGEYVLEPSLRRR